ncbi:MAG TPA: Sec-independent protein translocase protein TatB [Burkholderiales bacterium]|nr:Sec-independent protein translocase protein TatB [Burkholderiales bacterium]
MFDIGFSELMVIGVVALIVIGPERLPKVARTVGHLFGRMQRYVNDVKADINREMQLEELRKLQADMQEAARSFETSVNKEIGAAESEIQKIAQEANPTPLPAPAEAATIEQAPARPEPAVVSDPLTPAERSAQLELDIASPADAARRA